jgi:septum site-determining protein MinC
LTKCPKFLQLRHDFQWHVPAGHAVAFAPLKAPAVVWGTIYHFVFMSQSQPFHKPIEIKIATVVAISALLHESDFAVLDAALKEMTGGASDFFDDEFAIIDIGALGQQQQGIDWNSLIALFKSYRLNPVAVRNAMPELGATIVAHGLSLDVVTQPRIELPSAVVAMPKPVEVAAVSAAPAAAAPSAGAMIVDTPVRAGQRIYARGADLVITAVVNNGAEIIADGSIHVYAPLRGRALAGASGNTSSRIFAMSMEPELVSIAGIYRTFENGLPSTLAGHPAQVRLAGDRLDVLALNPAAR